MGNTRTAGVSADVVCIRFVGRHPALLNSAFSCALSLARGVKRVLHPVTPSSLSLQSVT